MPTHTRRVMRAAAVGQQPDPVLAGAVELARVAAQEEAGDEAVGVHVGVHAEDAASATHLFEATNHGYLGWRWAVTVAWAGGDTPVTVSEAVLLPGPDALVAPEWVPWERRVRAGDLGIGDLLPTPADDPRLVPAYLASDDPAVEQAVMEIGLGRMRVLSREGRHAAAQRWQDGEFGPRSEMARVAPAACGTCGYYLPLAGSLRAAFGVCGNEMAPADGRVVHVEYGCGAHSEADVEPITPVPVVEVYYDDAALDVEAAPVEPVDAGPGEDAAVAAGEAAVGEAVAGEAAVGEAVAGEAAVGEAVAGERSPSEEFDAAP